MAVGPSRHRVWIVGQSPHGLFLECLWRTLFFLGTVWGFPGSLLGPSWGFIGAVLGPLLDFLGASYAALGGSWDGKLEMSLR
eukprot:2409393-Pyramimonas_sp.AAC.1